MDLDTPWKEEGREDPTNYQQCYHRECDIYTSGEGERGGREGRGRRGRGEGGERRWDDKHVTMDQSIVGVSCMPAGLSQTIIVKCSFA